MSSIRVRLNGQRVTLRVGQTVWVRRTYKGRPSYVFPVRIHTISPAGGFGFVPPPGTVPGVKAMDWECVRDGAGTGRVFVTEAEAYQFLADVLAEEQGKAREWLRAVADAWGTAEAHVARLTREAKKGTKK